VIAPTNTTRVLVIRSGPGNPQNGSYYTEAALENAVRDGVFEGAQSFFDHPTTIEDKVHPERSVDKLAGWFDNVALDEYDDPQLGKCAGVFADFHPEAGNPDIVSLLATAAKYAQKYPSKSYIGFSINAEGSGELDEINGRTYRRVDEISRVLSVDVVTKAGAGGRPLAREAARQGADTAWSLAPWDLDAPLFSLGHAKPRAAPNCLRLA